MYKCKECNKPVIVLKETKVRTCDHTGTIVMDIEVQLEGRGGVKG